MYQVIQFTKLRLFVNSNFYLLYWVMETRIALATLYGNKVYYIQSDDTFRRVFADPREVPVFFESKNQMFQEWSGLEYLKVFDKKLFEEYKRSKYYGGQR